MAEKDELKQWLQNIFKKLYQRGHATFEEVEILSTPMGLESISQNILSQGFTVKQIRDRDPEVLLRLGYYLSRYFGNDQLCENCKLTHWWKET